MSGKPLSIVKFAPKGTESFHDAIKRRVDDYFRNNNISKYGNRKMYIKTAAMLSMYFVPFIFIVTGLASSNLWVFYGLWCLMGLGTVGIGTSVMHDANHGAYSKNHKVNNTIGSVLNFIGGYASNWKIQHNILHHTYTNIEGLDEDIDAGYLLRMSPHAPIKKFHRYQYIYAWFLYCLMNIFWVVWKDYKATFKYHETGLLVKEKLTLKKALFQVTAYKLFYLAYALVLPLIFTGLPWYHVVAGFMVSHMIAGLSLACIFQLAHVMETCEYPLPCDAGKMDNNWAVHQLLNTTNFSPRSTILSWFIGGLNFQIEHHLFPLVCHVHYPELSKIVSEVAKEHDLPYNVEPTFVKALGQHASMLKKLGYQVGFA